MLKEFQFLTFIPAAMDKISSTSLTCVKLQDHEGQS